MRLMMCSGGEERPAPRRPRGGQISNATRDNRGTLSDNKSTPSAGIRAGLSTSLLWPRQRLMCCMLPQYPSSRLLPSVTAVYSWSRTVQLHQPEISFGLVPCAARANLRCYQLFSVVCMVQHLSEFHVHHAQKTLAYLITASLPQISNLGVPLLCNCTGSAVTVTNPAGASGAVNSAAVAGSAAVTATDGGAPAAATAASGDNPRSERRGRNNRRYRLSAPSLPQVKDSSLLLLLIVLHGNLCWGFLPAALLMARWHLFRSVNLWHTVGHAC